MYLKDSWISKVEPLYKKYKYSPNAIEAVHSIWQWKNGGNPKPKVKKPLKLTFKLVPEGVIDEESRHLITDDSL